MNACAPEHTSCTHRHPDPVWRAKMGMFRTCDDIDEAKASRDTVSLANARTSMDDYRLALSMALGKSCDRNGYV